VLTPETSYETPRDLNSEPQNIEQETAEFRRVDFALLSLFLKSVEYLPSTFDIHYSIFAFSRVSFIDQTGLLRLPAARLAPET